MRIAISNLAWDVAEDEEVAAILATNSIDAIDIAPGKYFPDPDAASDADMARVRGWWRDRGVEITGMQALLFGTTGLNLFGSRESRAAMLRRLAAVCRIGEGVGAKRLVFGSPRNRDREGLIDADANRIATDFLLELGEIAARHGTVICVEPAPARYGGNFLTTTAQAATLVREIGHPAIRLQLDTGILALGGEDAARMIEEHADLVGHVHASEPDLVTLGDGGVAHEAIAAAIRRRLPGHLVTIEMLPAKDEPHTRAIARALDVALHAYRTVSPEVASASSAPRQVPACDIDTWQPRRHARCVVIPVVNEGARIASLLGRMAALKIADSADIVIVDGGSTDGSLEEGLLRSMGVRTLIVKTGAGKLGAQLRCAYAYALDEGYEWIVTIDGNDKDDPEAIPRIFAALESGADFVQASRFVPGGVAENTPALRSAAIRLIHAPLLSWSSGFRWTDTTQGFRGYSARMLRDPRLAVFRDVFARYELLAYLSHRAPRLGYRCVEVPSTRRYPADGKVPTKIAGWRGNLELLGTLVNACLGRYD